MIKNDEDFIKRIINEIKEFDKSIWYPGIKSIYFHEELKRKIALLGNQLGFFSVFEKDFWFDCPKLMKRRKGKLDIVWEKNHRIVCIFEIDSTRKIHSINKLLNCLSEYKFWIYYGRKNAIYSLRKIDSSQQIHLIRLESFKDRWKA